MPIIKEDPMRKYDPQAFSFNSVKGEVTEAMQFDWKRDKVDDAKKRAIYEAKSYDDFTQRVKGCTLKPIHRNEFNAPPKFAFNRSAGIAADAQPLAKILGAAPAASASSTAAAPTRLAPGAGVGGAAEQVRGGPALPKNCRELDRELRRRPTGQERAALLAELDGDALARLFARELDAEVLRQMLVALEEAAAPGEARRLLKDLAYRCPNQTALAATFLVPAERQVAARLLARDPAGDADEDVRICAALGVPIASVAAAAAPGTGRDEAASPRAPAAAGQAPVADAGSEAASAPAAAEQTRVEPASASAEAQAGGGAGAPAAAAVFEADEMD